MPFLQSFLLEVKKHCSSLPLNASDIIFLLKVCTPDCQSILSETKMLEHHLS